MDFGPSLPVILAVLRIIVNKKHTLTLLHSDRDHYTTQKNIYIHANSISSCLFFISPSHHIYMCVCVQIFYFSSFHLLLSYFSKAPCNKSCVSPMMKTAPQSLIDLDVRPLKKPWKPKVLAQTFPDT